ncbi:MAG TPA: hypothetical protein VGC21_20320 [Telluria sp.]
MNIRLLATSTGNAETKTQLEKTTLLPAAAGLFHHDFSWLPAAAGAATCHQADAGTIGPGKEEKAQNGTGLDFCNI